MPMRIALLDVPLPPTSVHAPLPRGSMAAHAAAAPGCLDRRRRSEPLETDVMDRSFLHSVSVGLPEMS